MTNITVVIPTHNPHPERLAQTLAGLENQTLSHDTWDVLLIDNASTVPLQLDLRRSSLPNCRVVREEHLGLTAARICGFRQAQGDLIVLVDDDNVLAPDYLEKVRSAFADDANLGAAGGRSVARYERGERPSWLHEFASLLAVRDLGTETIKVAWKRDASREYPLCAPIGAGMALRKTCAAAYVDEVSAAPHRFTFDRTGRSLTSGGDNDIIMCILERGWTVGYVPELTLFHLIPPDRCAPTYLARLNRAIARSWVRVLALHGIRPWHAIHPATVTLRKARALWRHRAWAGAANRIRWQGACGQFEGLADLWRADRDAASGSAAGNT